MLKRLFDIACATVGLVLLAPLLLVLAVAVRLDSPGPAIFRQRRVGLREREFGILKFRTMHTSGPAGALITASNDPRITRVGRILRRTKLDELPQLVNVLRGHMSLVGPRPEVSKYVSLYSTAVRAEIFSVRPGLTDYAAMEFRDESEILARSDDPERTYVETILPRKVDHYRRYVRERSFIGDVCIILRTLQAILR